MQTKPISEIKIFDREGQPVILTGEEMPDLRKAAKRFHDGVITDKEWYTTYGDQRRTQPWRSHLSAQIVHDELFGRQGWATDDAGNVLPQGGCAVRVTRKWLEAEAGSIGIIGGTIGRPSNYESGLHITFRFRAFIGNNGIYDRDTIYVSCGGGPSTIWENPATVTYTGEEIGIWAWRWREYRQGDGGEQFWLKVPLFDWTPSQ